jgi:predicted N-acetyltransferase YhbS
MPQDAPTSSGVSIHFRLAEEADQSRLIALVNAAFSVETFLEGTRTDGQRLAEDMRRGSIVVAEDGRRQLLGCVYTEARGTLGYIGMLAVDPAHQCAGLGIRLAQAAERHLRRQGCKAVEITVLSLRKELPPIYRRFGYVETGAEEFHATQKLKSDAKCHGIVMRKQL